MHHIDADKAYWEKAQWELHKNATSCIEQILEATTTNQQLYGHAPLISKTMQIRRTRHAGHCWRSKEELISNILRWTASHGGVSVGLSTKTYLQQLCSDTGCSLDLPEAMNDTDKWWEKEIENQGNSCYQHDMGMIYIYIYMGIMMIFITFCFLFCFSFP